MAITHESGPTCVYGVIPGEPGNANPDAGPSIEYQGASVLDPRTGYKPGMGVQIFTHFDCPYVLMTNQIPWPLSATAIVANTADSANKFTLAGATNGITVLSATNPGLVFQTGLSTITSGLAIDVPYQPLKLGKQWLFDPTRAIARVLQYKSSAADTRTVTVTGADIYGVNMTETITLNGVTPVIGKKAYKYVFTATASGTSANTVSIGTTDTFGFNIRSSQFEQLNMFWNNAYVTTNTGYTTSLALGTPSTATTADIRGTYAVQTAATNGTVADSIGRATTGLRLAMFVSVLPNDMVAATPSNFTSLYGMAQF